VGIMALLSEAIGLGVTEQMGSWDILSYMMFFILGHMLFASPGLQEAIRKQGRWFLAGAVIISALHLMLTFYVRPSFYDSVDIRLLATWGWVVGLLWLARLLLNFTDRFLTHVNKMVLPFYILHQTLIIVVAYFIVQTNLAAPIKYGITALLAFASIVVIYELLVSRVGVLRFIFGMKSRTVKYRPASVDTLAK
jgi:glucan biosynthesis protein C